MTFSESGGTDDAMDPVCEYFLSINSSHHRFGSEGQAVETMHQLCSSVLQLTYSIVLLLHFNVILVA